MQNQPAAPTAFTIDSMLTIKEAQDLFRVSRSTIMRWVSEGKLEKLTFSISMARITGSSVQALIQSARQG